ncbi:PaaI family thioesterase [Melioribacteraceae bacterium 4301-Me]|uniref:PaaI family thioesterase n=1 Tax=Pyranulibacter aquaticus TaxID=3163344 RepID=UPI00359A9EFA
MNKQLTAEKAIEKMLKSDKFSRWLRVKIVESKKGYCKLEMKVRKEMMNGFNIVHGGVTFSLADSALAFASNSYGKVAVVIENNISFVKPVRENDILIATAEEQSRNNHLGVYSVEITNQKNEKVAVFKGTVYITNKNIL